MEGEPRRTIMSYAIIKTGGKQYRVKEGDRLDVEKLDAQVGDTVTFDEVLMVSNGDAATLGSPFVDGAKVTAEVTEQFRKVASRTDATATANAAE